MSGIIRDRGPGVVSEESVLVPKEKRTEAPLTSYIRGYEADVVVIDKLLQLLATYPEASNVKTVNRLPEVHQKIIAYLKTSVGEAIAEAMYRHPDYQAVLRQKYHQYIVDEWHSDAWTSRPGDVTGDTMEVKEIQSFLHNE